MKRRMMDSHLDKAESWNVTVEGRDNSNFYVFDDDRGISIAVAKETVTKDDNNNEYT